MIRFLVFLSFCFLLSPSWSQADSVDVKKPKKEKKKKVYPTDTSYHHSVKRAILFSALVPGTGQMYNEYGYRKYRNKKHRAWWKVPIIYGGLGVLGYYFYDNYWQAKLLKEEYLIRQDNPNLSFHHPQFEGFSEGNLTSEFDFFSRRRDIFAFATVAFYGLQIVEALVDAHFVTFDVSQDLSFYWNPVMLDRQTAGLNIGLRF